MKELIKNTDFQNILSTHLKRREFVLGSLHLGLSSLILSSRINMASADEKNNTIRFKNVSANSLDTVTLPEGYNWQRVISWGDPMFPNAPEFDQITRGNSQSQNLSFGDNNDGMHFHPLEPNKGLLIVNNEYANLEYVTPNLPHIKDDISKTQAAVGLSICEINFNGTSWKLNKNSKYNRRVTAQTPHTITGPCKNHPLLTTQQDPSAKVALGTWANCGQGSTPWGTYLTCEENFNGFFASSDKKLELSKDQKRYGLKLTDWKYNWFKWDERFDLAKEKNEANRVGYVVEIDPLEPNSPPRKLTALGRFKHENAEVVVAENGHIVVYMGDDERGEFLYKYISNNKISNNKSQNMKLLEEGTLYVAKFDSDSSTGIGTGSWIELTFGKNGLDESNGFKDQAEVLVFARRAGSTVGATTMDRPEWVASHPNKPEIYCALTNNSHRGKRPNAGGDKTPVEGPNPREANLYGQIVRWQPKGGDHTSLEFSWDLFAVAGNPSVHSDEYAGSSNINSDNMFNSPDGLAFDSSGRLWIQTDGKYSNKGEYEGMGNNQMLCADTTTGEIKRFMVGPVACEITGLTWSEDQTTLFVGIQHPGEKGNISTFPDGKDKVPRSSVIAIRRDDGGIIGS